ncbi:MAG: HDIG domain-containing metalloprotein [Patescibacteria group bacterium]|jgi:putative nucleotidyltransferase with HDIG domain
MPPEGLSIAQDETLVPVEASLDKTHYFQYFAMHYLMPEMRILRRGRALVRPEADGWRQISEHCLSEAVGADILAEALGANREMVRRAALLHDWYKRRELELKKEHGMIEGYRISNTEDLQLLRGYGVPEELIRLSHSNTLENADPDYLASRTLEEKIVHFMDLITDYSNWVSYLERRKRPQNNPKAIEWSESFREQYDGASLFEMNQRLEALERGEFEEALGLEPGTLVNFMRQRLNERIKQLKREQESAKQDEKDRS